MKRHLAATTFLLAVALLVAALPGCPPPPSPPTPPSDNNLLTQAVIDALQLQGQAENWTFTVGMNGIAHLSHEQLCGFVDPDYEPYDPEVHGEGLDFESSAAKQTLPQSFDWRTQGGTTPIRNQGGCGSCWAFATLGVVESAIKIVDARQVDLAEQWLVSCNTFGYNCIVGGWWAYDHLISRPDKCGQVGAVRESDFPYTASHASPNCPYERHELLEDWGHAATGDYRYPTVTDLKRAIYNYGPIATAVRVSKPFEAYKSGVFNADSHDEPDHAVILVGWDDRMGHKGAWILRNSWGTSWGENGYMYIAYGCSSIGYGGSYVVYSGTGGAPTAAFTATPRSGNAPLTVQFTDTSVPGSASITSWAWNFGDGGTSSQRNPSHSYSSAGTYTVALTVRSSAGSDTETKTSHITVQGTGSLQVFLAGPTAARWRADGDPQWFWRPSGLIVAGMQPGVHTVEFNNVGGWTSPSNQDVTIVAGETTVASATYTQDAVSVTVPNVVGMAQSSAESAITDAGLIVGAVTQQYSNTVSAGNVIAQSPVAGTSVAPDSSVSLVVSKGPEQVIPPTAAFTAVPRSGEAPLAVQFTDTSTPGSSSITSWAWNFGDGGTSSQPNPSHTYGRPGTYSVALTVTTTVGSDTETKMDHVSVTGRIENEIIILPGGVPLEMVWIPGWTFMMGRYPGEQDSSENEAPRHQVRVPGFWMGKYAVTKAQWTALLPDWIPWWDPNQVLDDDPNSPAVNLQTLTSIQLFVTALNTHTDKTFRLPSEAEWEYACRAGTTTRFYWGDDPGYAAGNAYCWWSYNASGLGEAYPHMAGQKIPNAWGLYDMSGNVWEWCEDKWHENYEGAPTDGSPWVDPATTPQGCVLRGGAYYSPGERCRSAHRTNTPGRTSPACVPYGIRMVSPPSAGPTAAFTVTPRSGEVPLTVQFTDTSDPGLARDNKN